MPEDLRRSLGSLAYIFHWNNDDIMRLPLRNLGYWVEEAQWCIENLSGVRNAGT